ncbi:MAG: acyl CoA:acetate/3-ketoacid CoA transferase [Syntrophobacterales bacterium]|nr:MAG: acyl CoA:acetate/3-ketoacid CoA transferase [Syntrophobacterales bacterium]
MASNESPSNRKSIHPVLLGILRTKNKVVTAEEAVRVIQDGDTIATGGFVGSGVPEEILLKLEEYYLETGRPRNLTLVYAAGNGDWKTKGGNHFGNEGLVKRVVGGHWGSAPRLANLALTNKVEAYNFPQGVISHLYRDIAAGKPRTITTVGLQTYVDPRLSGGKINEKAKEDLVELVHFDGKEYLAYKTFPINVGIIRGTTADTDGNVTMEKEALTLEAYAIAAAAKNSGGFVIVQVERIAEKGTLPARQVKVPGILVDCIVVASPENHMQTFGEQYNPSFSGEVKIPVASLPIMEMGPRKIIARRAAFELQKNSVINLGIGMPEGISNVANEEKILNYMTLTAEPGIIGGLPAGGLNFGAGTNPDCVIDQPYQFDFYDGGGLDCAFLGLAQADKDGNLNVSKFGPKFAGCGGFINISQNAKKVVFVGTFTAGGLKVAVQDGKILIEQEGREKKFHDQVEQVTFSGKYAAQKGTPVLFVTERCVFSLTKEGMELTEVAPGIDIEKDILAQMGFKPIVRKPRLMDERIFRLRPMGLESDLLSIPLEERLTYYPDENLFFANLEGYHVKSSEQIKEIEAAVRKILKPVGKKVYTIVNYDNFNILPDLMDEYTELVKGLVEDFYIHTTGYSTSAFARMKLGEALAEKQKIPHMYETREEEHNALKPDQK